EAVTRFTCAGDARAVHDGLGLGPLAAALRARDVVIGSDRRLIPNPLRTYFAERGRVAQERDQNVGLGPGMVMDAGPTGLAPEVRRGEGQAINASLFCKHPRTGARVALPLHFKWDDTVPAAGVLVWNHDAYRRAQRSFYGTLIFDDPELAPPEEEL